MDLWGKSLMSAEMFKMDGFHRAKYDIPDQLNESWNTHHPNWKKSLFHLENFSW